MGKADIELLFGVAGGGSPSGPSGKMIKSQLDNIIGNINKNPLEVEIAPSKGSVKNFQRELSNLTAFAQSEAKQIQAAYKAAFDTVKISKTQTGGNNNSFQNNTASILKKDTKEYYKAASELSRLQMSVRENLRSWTKAKNGASADEYKNLERQSQRIETLNKVLERGKLSAEDYAKYLNKISSSIAKSENVIHLNRENSGTAASPAKLVDGMVAYDKAIVSVNTKLNEYRKKIAAWSAAATGSTQADYDKLNLQFGNLKTLLSDLKSGTLTAEQFASRFNLIKREASEAADAINEAGMAFKSGDDTKAYHKQLDKINDLLVKIKKNLNDWSSAKDGSSSSSYRDLERTAQEVEGLRNELISTGHALDNFDNRFDEMSSSAKQFATNIKLAGENTKSIKGRVQNLMSTLGISLTYADMFHKAIEIGRKMVEVVTEVDVAMTELKKVTDEADSTYTRFLKNAKDRAHGLGATVAETVNATADFSRLGHDLDDASSLADAAIVYKNVADGIDDISEASASIVSTMQAFKVEAKDAMSLVDKFNEVNTPAS